MRHFMKIELSATEGALIRALGLIERRAFSIQSCRLHEASDNRRTLELWVESDRPVAVLKRQLERLHDVQTVHLPFIAQHSGKVAFHTAMGSH